MIDEMIPDLADPKLRALYDALLGRREPTMDEKAVLLGVGTRISEALAVFPAHEVVQIELIIDRAWKIDEQGVKDRFYGYCEDAQRQIEKDARHDRQV